MRYIEWKNHKVFVRNLIFFIMGIYIGFIICLFFYGEQIDHLIYKNDQLAIDLESCQEENDALLLEQKQHKSQLIRSVKFKFMDKLEPFEETELLKALVNETNFLIGKKVDDVSKSPEFIYQLLNGKVFMAQDKKYEVRVKIIYVQSTTEIWISVKEQKNT